MRTHVLSGNGTAFTNREKVSRQELTKHYGNRHRCWQGIPPITEVMGWRIIRLPPPPLIDLLRLEDRDDEVFGQSSFPMSFDDENLRPAMFADPRLS